MQDHVDVAIIGAGSAGLSALRQVRKVTDNYLLIDPGPLGTTCARVGCMPSKALIHIANAYHRRHTFAETGISGAEHLRCDIPAVLRHVRTLRDRFTAGRHSFGADGASACYCRRPPLRIVFSDPQCAVVGQSFSVLRDTRIVIGRVDFRQQARAMIEGRNSGVLRLYAEASSGRILGAEMVAPEAEHLAHLLAACIHANMTVQYALQLPFYHPTLEEGLRTALRDAAKQLREGPTTDGLHLCESCPESALQ